MHNLSTLSGSQSKKGCKDQESIQSSNLTKDKNGKVTNSQLDTTNECREVSLFHPGDNKAHINRRAKRHSKTRQKQNKRSTKEVPPWNGQQNLLLNTCFNSSEFPISVAKSTYASTLLAENDVILPHHMIVKCFAERNECSKSVYYD